MDEYSLHIAERRKFVKGLMLKGLPQNVVIRTTRNEYDVRYSSVLLDIAAINNESLPYGCSSARGIKLHVLKRDRFVCQYCGSKFESGSQCVVEHIIPEGVNRLGVTEAYNLVCACQSCNRIKAQEIWIPKNIVSITKNKMCFREYVLCNATRDCRTVLN